MFRPLVPPSRVQPISRPRPRGMTLCMDSNNPQPRFSLGKLVATPGALEALESNRQNAGTFLSRHQLGDWGDMCDADKQSNDLATAHEGDPGRQQRVLSSYSLENGATIWIITEWDRSTTTVLLPNDY